MFRHISWQELGKNLWWILQIGKFVMAKLCINMQNKKRMAYADTVEEVGKNISYTFKAVIAWIITTINSNYSRGSLFVHFSCPVHLFTSSREYSGGGVLFSVKNYKIGLGWTSSRHFINWQFELPGNFKSNFKPIKYVWKKFLCFLNYSGGFNQ